MKKLLCIIIVLLCILAFSSCRRTDDHGDRLDATVLYQAEGYEPEYCYFSYYENYGPAVVEIFGMPVIPSYFEAYDIIIYPDNASVLYAGQGLDTERREYQKMIMKGLDIEELPGSVYDHLSYEDSLYILVLHRQTDGTNGVSGDKSYTLYLRTADNEWHYVDAVCAEEYGSDVKIYRYENSITINHQKWYTLDLKEEVEPAAVYNPLDEAELFEYLKGAQEKGIIDFLSPEATKSDIIISFSDEVNGIYYTVFKSKAHDWIYAAEFDSNGNLLRMLERVRYGNLRQDLKQQNSDGELYDVIR